MNVDKRKICRSCIWKIEVMIVEWHDQGGFDGRWQPTASPMLTPL